MSISLILIAAGLVVALVAFVWWVAAFADLTDSQPDPYPHEIGDGEIQRWSE